MVGLICAWANRATSLWQVIPPMTEPKRVLLVQCHPCPDSFNEACALAVMAGLKHAGHDVRFKKLYSTDEDGMIQSKNRELNGIAYCGKSFPPSLTNTERKDYQTIADSGQKNWEEGVAKLTPEVSEAISDLRWAQALVVVYPTWWMNVPGTLKGWIDRTFLPHVAFRLPKQVLFEYLPYAPCTNSANSPVVIFQVREGPPATETGLQPLLTNIERVGVVTTYGASPWIVAAAGDNGRRMWSRALRPLFSPTCALRWHGLHDMDNTTKEQREMFLAEVEEAYKRF
jgi:NAD(P)H dehydrogenase (quinone)